MNKIEEIMGLVNTVQKNRICAEMSPSNRDYFNGAAEDAYKAIESALRELVREQDEAKKYADMLAMCMFKKHYAQDADYTSGRVKFELFDSVAGVISQIDNMASGLSRAHGIGA